MRTQLWKFAVAAAVLAIIGSLAVDYAWEHPRSFLGRCLFTAPTVAGFPMGPVTVSGKIATMTCNSVRGLMDTRTTATWDHNPNHPPQAPPCEDGAVTQPTLLPGAVVLRVERDSLPVEAMPPVHDAVSARGVAEACEDVQMPLVEDVTAVMPSVEEDTVEPFLAETYIPPSGEGYTKHPDIDTMEARPSDLWFLDFVGPF